MFMDGKNCMKLHYGAQTDVGQTREHNEDTFGVADDPRITQFGQLFIVCDGIGGYLAGEVASKLAVETILESYYNATNEQRLQALIQALHMANQAIYQQGRGSMGTTCVAALFYAGTLFVANVGDSRGYLIRNGQPRQITHDHSFVAEQVRAGLMTPEQARISNVKNIITRAIGHQPDVQIDIFRESLQQGDIILLCSDGLHGLVEDEELVEIAVAQPPQEAVEKLIDLANERGGSDNITAIIVRVESIEPAPLGDEDPLLASLLASEPDQQRTEPVTAQVETERLNGREIPTERLQTGNVETARPAPAAPPPAPVSAPARMAPVHAAPTTRPTERRLSKAGLLISLLLLLTLGAAAIYLARPEWLGLDPAGSSLPAATASPTVVPTQTPSRLPTPEGTRPANQSGEETQEPTPESYLDRLPSIPNPFDQPTATPAP
ncbi:MAG: hypothetical protein KatS3mg057_0228 [Herpetosiphonaceae bacterium]|nr:MAG: hypothetical protein KatS3mg057_0228 [Herpetosiphonaceae bacterium]